MNISTWLRNATKQLKDIGITSARLDAEVLLAHNLGKDRTYLHAHPDKELAANTGKDVLLRRLKREPLAYITGRKEFFGREFVVTPDVLIPRPETEDLIELTDQQGVSLLQGDTLLDVGCGSGCVGITLKLKHPGLDVTLSDISTKALGVAQQNAAALRADVHFAKSDLLSHFLTSSPAHFNIIVANLPYVDKAWETSPELNYEPTSALYAESNGLELIFKLIKQAPKALKTGGYLILEADPVQHGSIVKHSGKFGLKHLRTHRYGLLFEKN